MSLIPQPPVGSGPKAAIALKLLRVGVVIVIGAWFLLLAAWLALHWLILPNIDEWRGPIEQRASAALGANVKIGRLEVESRGWVPAFRLHDVVLHDRAGREALRLPRVAAALSARSLLQLEPHFVQLLIDAPVLEVRRDPQGRISVAGFELGGSGGSGDSTDWFANQREFVIRGGTLRWVDEQRGVPPLEFSDVQFVLRNGLRRHDLRLDATPPPEFGSRISVHGRFNGALLKRRGDWRHWSGTLYAETPLLELAAWRARLDLPFALDDGRGALRGWVELDQGRVRSATLDATVHALALRLGPALLPLSLTQASGRLEAQRGDAGWTFGAQQIAFATADGRDAPAATLRLALRQADDGGDGLPSTPVTGGEFSADRLDLGLLGYLAERLPVGEAVRGKLADYALQGQVAPLALRWEGALAAPAQYQLDASATAFALAPRAASSPRAGARPGVSNAAFSVSANERGGSGRVSVADGVIEFPGVFDEAAVALQTFESQLTWRVERGSGDAPPAVLLEMRDARFANADMSGRFDATWSTGAGTGQGRGGRLPGLLDLQGRLDHGRATRVARYLPRALPDSARRYVEQAVRAGSVADVVFKARGDLADFPASNVQQGEFRIAGRVVDTTFDFAPGQGWPEIRKLEGELVFDRSTMSIRNARGQLGGYALEGLNGGIANLADRPVFALAGGARGTLADGIAFIGASPLAAMTDPALARINGSGDAEVKLALEIPLDERPNGVKGSVTLNGNDVRLRPDLPWLRNARGRVDFTQDGFAVVGASARVLGGEASFEGGRQPDGSLHFSGQGVASAEGLRAAGDWAALAPLAASLSGQAAYRLTLGIARGEPELLLTSTLQGLGSTLPAPLGKAADAALALRVQTRLEPNALRDTLSVELGNLLQASYVRDLSGGSARVLRGAVGIGAAAVLPAAGVQAQVQLAAFDADAWQQAARRLGAGGAGDAGSGGYLPDTVALRVDDFVASGRRLTRLVAGVSRVGEVWRATVDAEQLEGYAEWRPDARGSGQLYARLARLTLPRAEAESVESLLDSGANPPALDIVIDDLTLRDKRLGRVEVEAEARAGADGPGHDWRLSKLTMSVPEARLDASGQWQKPAAPGQRRRSRLDLRLTIQDAGAFLERLGTHGALRGGKGQIGGELSWDGSPLSLDIASLAGQIDLEVASGQFLKAEPGAARLLGVLSLQALPRRLALDFRDVFQEGFLFDSAEGNVTVEHGVAHSNNLRIRGVQAVVLMEGSADLVKETQDLRVVVVPEINAGTASLAYAVINPAVGLGTFLAQLLLRKPIIAAGTREFEVSGTWADPKVEPKVREPGEPAPEIDEGVPR